MKKIQLKAYTDYDLRSQIIKHGLKKVSYEHSTFFKKMEEEKQNKINEKKIFLKKMNIVFDKPGYQLTWEASKKLAEREGGRLLTLKEARECINGTPFYPEEDQWCAIGTEGNRDWVQVGNKHHNPGKSHV